VIDQPALASKPTSASRNCEAWGLCLSTPHCSCARNRT